MDAKVDDWVVTPRRGKAVEINALWFNALKLMEQWAPGLESDATFWIAHNILGRIYTRQGRYEEAIAAFVRARELSSDSPEVITQLGYALAKSGKHEQAQATLKELRLIAAEKYVPAYSFAMIYNGLGEREDALKHLEKSFQEREAQLTFIKIDTRWDGLRAEPRFQAILRGVGF